MRRLSASVFQSLAERMCCVLCFGGQSHFFFLPGVWDGLHLLWESILLDIDPSLCVDVSVFVLIPVLVLVSVLELFVLVELFE